MEAFCSWPLCKTRNVLDVVVKICTFVVVVGVVMMAMRVVMVLPVVILQPIGLLKLVR